MSSSEILLPPNFYTRRVDFLTNDPNKFYELKNKFLSIDLESLDNLSIQVLKQLSDSLEEFINVYFLPFTAGSTDEFNSDFYQQAIFPCYDTFHLKRLINERISKFETASLPQSPPSPEDVAIRMMKV